MSRETILLVADSTNTSLSFSVLNMPSDSANSLSCRIGEQQQQTLGHESLERQTVLAISRGGRVKCKEARFKYEADVKESNFTLELIQNQEVIDKVPVN